MSEYAFPFGSYDHGLTKREYFAAHAPDHPLWDFKVIMPTERPKPVWESEASKSCGDLPTNYDEVKAWDAELKRQTAIQWRWAYADAMMEVSNAKS